VSIVDISLLHLINQTVHILIKHTHKSHYSHVENRIMKDARSVSLSPYIWSQIYGMLYIRYTLKCVWCSTKTSFNVYVSQRSQIQLEDVDHAVYKGFR